MTGNTTSLQLGTQNLITDVTGLKVGQAEDEMLLSGVTVITADNPFTAACHVMGGAPGTRETELLNPEMLVNQIDALVLSGGSAFGLGAASGVCDFMAHQNRGYAIAGQHVPIVPAAILFDLVNGGDKNWIQNPYYQLGIDAYSNCSSSFALGSFGAGKGAMAGASKGGIGSASINVKLPDGVSFTIGALAAVNSFGSPFVPGSDKFWAAPFEIGDEFGGRGFIPQPDPLALPITKTGFSRRDSRANTTIAVVATDLTLTNAEAQRLAITAHDGFARALVPSHCFMDGDIVFSVATGAKDCSLTPSIQTILGHVGSVTMARAIARGVYYAS